MMKKIVIFSKNFGVSDVAGFHNKFVNGIRFKSSKDTKGPKEKKPKTEQKDSKSGKEKKGAEQKKDKIPPWDKLQKPAKRPIFMDAQSTSPVDPRVLDRMMPYLVEQWGNPHSQSHYLGWESGAAVEKARLQVATLIGADASEVIFTSGATESNNIALKGVLRSFRQKKVDKNQVITMATEHKCILESCHTLESEGFKALIMPVQSSGLVDLQALEKAITPQTALVSVMTVNNEIGVHQPIDKIAAMCDSKNVLFHTDAAQATGKVPINVHKQKIRLMSMSAHKVYGPKGVGALFISKKKPVNVLPHTSGGGQEMGYRSGTVPTPLVVGMGAACEIAQQEIAYDHKRISFLSKRFQDKILKNLSHVKRNGSAESTYPGCFNLSFSYVEGDSLLMGLQDVALSSGSACTSKSLKASYVLHALGMPVEQAQSSIRFGIGRFTTLEEIDFTAERCIAQVKKLREMSPLWEMVQEGVDLKSIIWAQH